MDEQIRFLENSEIFESLSAEELKTVLDRGRMETHSPGSIIFNIGDSSDAVYVVKAGIVEICRATGEDDKMSVVAYFGESDPIGEAAIFTGSPRASMARVPEKVEILRIDRGDFMQLLMELPWLSLTLLGIFAKRLERGFRKERVADRRRHLSGKLMYFDLPTIIQTLANSKLTGTLTIREHSGKVFAILYFEDGRMLYAKLGHLRGKEAFYQLFQSSRQDAFSFKGGPLPDEFLEDSEVAMSTMSLLLESTRQQDELKVLKTHYPNPDRVFQPRSKTLTWNDEATQLLAEEIWGRLQGGETIGQMVSEIPVCEYPIYKVLYAMKVRELVA